MLSMRANMGSVYSNLSLSPPSLSLYLSLSLSFSLSLSLSLSLSPSLSLSLSLSYLSLSLSLSLSLPSSFRYDIPSAIPDGSIQRAGENVMALLKEVINSPLLSHPEEDDVHGKIIFFDVMGLMMVVYSERLGIVVNLVTAAVVLLTVYIGTAPSSSKKLSSRWTKLDTLSQSYSLAHS